MNAKISIFVICDEAIIYICYYIICITVPLTNCWGFQKNADISNFIMNFYVKFIPNAFTFSGYAEVNMDVS